MRLKVNIFQFYVFLFRVSEVRSQSSIAAVEGCILLVADLNEVVVYVL